MSPEQQDEENLRRALLEDVFPKADSFFENQPFAHAIPDRLAFERNAAVAAWMTQAAGHPVQPGSATWQADKDALVQGFFLRPNQKNVTDEEVHGLIRQHITTADLAVQEGRQAAMAGTPAIAARQAFDAQRGGSPLRAKWDDYAQEFQAHHHATAQKRAEYEDLIRTGASIIQEEGEAYLPVTQQIQSVADRLLKEVPSKDQRFVIASIGATAAKTPDEQKSYLRKLATSLGRGTESLGSSIESGFTDLSLTMGSMPTVDDYGRIMHPPIISPEKVDENRKYYLMANLIRKTLDEGVPLEEDGYWAQSGLSVARSLPVTATAFVPYAGWVARSFHYRDEVATTLMQQNPDMELHDADRLALIASPFLATVSGIADRLPYARLPFLDKVLGKGGTSLTSLLTRTLVRTGIAVPGEIAEEIIENRVPLYLQEVSAALDKDIPGVDWHRRNQELAKLPVQAFGPALLLSVIGASGTSISQVQQGRQLASDPDLLIASGASIPLAEAISTQALEGQWQQVDRLLPRLTQPTGHADTATPEQRQAAALRIQHRTQQADKAEQHLLQQAGISIRKVGQQWEVSNVTDGTAALLPTAEEAMALFRSQVAGLGIQEDERTFAVFEAFSQNAAEGAHFTLTALAETAQFLNQKQPGLVNEHTHLFTTVEALLASDYARQHPFTAEQIASLRTAEGFHDGKTGHSIVIAENTRLLPGENAQQALTRVVLHERVGHAGLQILLGSAESPRARRWAALSAQIPQAELDAIAGEAGYQKLAGDRRALAYEWFARRTEKDASLLVKDSLPRQMWDAFREMVMDVMARVGLNPTLGRSFETQVNDLKIRARNAALRPIPQAVGSTGPAPEARLQFSHRSGAGQAAYGTGGDGLVSPFDASATTPTNQRTHPQEEMARMQQALHEVLNAPVDTNIQQELEKLRAADTTASTRKHIETTTFTSRKLIQGGGINFAFELRNGVPVIYKPALFQSREKIRAGIEPSTQWRREIAASLVAEHLSISLIPPTARIESINGEGSAQLMKEGFLTGGKLISKLADPFFNARRLVSGQLAEDWQLMEDLLLEADRHQENYMVKMNEKGEVIDLALIDNGLSLSANLGVVKKHYNGPREGQEIGALNRQRLRELIVKQPEIEKALEGYLEDTAVAGIFARAKALLARGRYGNFTIQEMNTHLSEPLQVNTEVSIFEADK